METHFAALGTASGFALGTGGFIALALTSTSVILGVASLAASFFCMNYLICSITAWIRLDSKDIQSYFNKIKTHSDIGPLKVAARLLALTLMYKNSKARTVIERKLQNEGI